MKNFLKWLFEDRMREVEDLAWKDYMNRRKDYVAEGFLEKLGYGIRYESGAREIKEDDVPILAPFMGFRLIKKPLENK